MIVTTRCVCFPRNRIPFPELFKRLVIAVGVSLCLSCSTHLARLPNQSFERASLPARESSAHADLPTQAIQRDGVQPPSKYKIPDGQQSALPFQGEITRQRVASLVPQSIAPDIKPFSATGHMISVNAVDAPLQALLFSMAMETGLDLNIVGQLQDIVTVKLHQVSLSSALDQLARQSSLAWQISGDLLTIWVGDAYQHNYPVDYLNLERSTRSTVGLATQVGTINAADAQAGGIANSSQTKIESASDYQFWQRLEADIKGLVAAGAQGSSARSGTYPNRFSINPEAGLLTLYASPEIHHRVQRYLSLLHENTQRQVLIEATVVEVTLSDSFEAGVDWQLLAAGSSGLSAAQLLVGAPLLGAGAVGALAAPAGLVSLIHNSGIGDVNATLSLLEQFGDVRILSRPRIIALNNQSSVLKVVDNRVYFTAKVERSQSETRNDVVTETEIHTVPVGLVMNVTPQISQSGSVMLTVRPTLSRILGFVNDPNPALALSNVRNGVPEIQVRELESMLMVQSGEVAVIGGLMQETREENDARLPGLGRMPVLGKLFSKRARKHRQTELLIVLRPTVIPARGRRAVNP